MNKHTPGPWSVGGPTGFVNQVYIEPAIGAVYGSGDEAQANAHLIAAAPELLEALQEALEDWDDDHFDEEYPYRAEWAEKARAAIAKALTTNS